MSATIPTVRQEHLRPFQQLLQTLAAPSSPIPPFSVTAAVGAHYDPTTGLSRRDGFWLHRAWAFCGMFKIPVSQPIVKIVDYPAHDFLDPKTGVQADLVVAKMIVNPDAVMAVRDSQNDFRLASAETLARMQEKVPALRTSPLHGPGAWHDAAKMAGARMIVAISHTGEIQARDFAGPDYREGPWANFKAPNLQGGQSIYRLDTLLRQDLGKQLIARGVLKRDGATLAFDRK